ncbi:MAG TPA: NAD-dependent epimerase/dehydratase family protein [Kofleriaceae bacterium]|nr:NAD-dependent epimerase/dehydratase family protein [Kofleriaceae bacterium]
MLDRRRFVLGSLAGMAAACAPRRPAPDPAPPRPAPARGKTILILGGTNFLGPQVVAAARARGHTLTLFNRGKTHPGMFPDLEQLHGDRDGHLEALAGRSWDAVVDTSGYVPRIVKASAELLAPRVGHYVFISTISVYAGENVVGADETAPVSTIADPTNEDVKTNYGALKALCERAAEAALPGRVANIRPGLIVGPGDPTGRFSHWPSRMAEGGDVLAPGDGSTPVQWIDVRDLGAWIVHAIERRTVGVYNALGPAQRTTMKEVIDACNHAAGDKATPVWVDAAFLAKQGVSEWQDMPMWADAKGDDAGFGTRSNRRAVAAGLTFRPIGDTARDTLAWLAALPEDERAKRKSSGIARDRELAVIAAWRAR